MSLARRGGRGLPAPRKPPKARRKKAEWDGTVHDLTVHRATPEEQAQRHEMHKSKNKVLAQLELQEKALKAKWKKQRPRVPESLEKKKLALMREILSDQYRLQDVLERSDQAMAVVKDLFGDAPRRHLGFPNVTVAPGCEAEFTQSPIVQKRDPPTHLSILSESVMDPQALNEVGESFSTFPLEGESVQDRSFNSVSSTDANRLLRLPKENSVSDCQEKAMRRHASSLQEASLLATPKAGLPSLDCTALNATNVVKRVHSRLENEEQIADITYIVQQVLNANRNKQKQISARVKKTQKVLTPDRQKRGPLSSAAATWGRPSGQVSSLDVLNQMMHDVEQEMEEYERWTGQKVQKAPNGHGLSGFTYSLVNALCRVMRFLKESEMRLRQEVLNRHQLEGEVREQRALVDALTAEILLVREENLTLQSKLQQYMFVTDEQLTSLTRALKGLPTSESSRTRSPGEAGGLPAQSPNDAQGKPLLNYVEPKRDVFMGEKVLEFSQRDLPGKGPMLPNSPDSARIGQILSAPLIQPAVLLTPPQQKSSQASPPLQDERESGQEGRSSVSGKPPAMQEDGVLSPPRGRGPTAKRTPQSWLQAEGQPVRSAFSAVARPGAGGFAERPTCVPDDALQRQIAELAFQNSALRAQLSQFWQPHQEAGDGLEQPCTAAKASDQEVQETSQAASTSKEPPKSLDERIAELNRQSTEARSKLLQLINQQKLATFVSVSPPISPIPSPPANSSETGRRKIEVTVPVAETLDCSKEDTTFPAGGTTNTRRSAGTSDRMSLPLIATLGDAPLISDSRRVKAEKQREEGWFALSMHVR